VDAQRRLDRVGAEVTSAQRQRHARRANGSIKGNVATIARGFGITSKLTGETDEEIADSSLEQMLDGEHARRV
jgi:hypothetical protein